MKMLLSLSLILLFVLSCSGSDSSPTAPEDNTVTDIDGNVYNAIKIGDQWWMVENLKVTQYRNGDAIPVVTDSSEWSDLTTGAYCMYDNNASNADTYGYLYNWYAVDDNRGLGPEGWHIPTDDDWKELEMYLGMSQSEADSIGGRGTDEGGKLKEAGTSHWRDPNTGATNESGFTALPGGFRLIYPGDYNDIASAADYWSSSLRNNTHVWNRRLYYTQSGIRRGYTQKRYGFSVRCVRDK